MHLIVSAPSAPSTKSSFWTIFSHYLGSASIPPREALALTQRRTDMNSRDRILAAMDRQPVDRIPTDIWATAKVTDDADHEIT